MLAHHLSPRYIFSSSTVETSQTGVPFLSKNKQHLSRATILANFGMKPEGSKATYIKALEIEPINSMKDMKKLKEEIEETGHLENH